MSAAGAQVTDVDFTNPVASALWLAGRGMFVFPVDHPSLEQCAGIRTKDHDPTTCNDRGKHPVVKWSTVATTDPKQIDAWFNGSPRNIGVACKPSKLFVPDEDVAGGLARFAADQGHALPDSLAVRTGRGKHLYLADETGKLGNSAGPLKAYGVDVRGGGTGAGGYVVGPGSLHASGVLYEPYDADASVLAVPGWLAEAINGKRQHGDEFRSTGTSNGNGTGTGFQPGTIPYGTRDDQLFRFASWLRGEGYDIAEAKARMQRRWQDCEQPAGYFFTLDAALAKVDAVYATYAPGNGRGTQTRSGHGKAGPADAPPAPPAPVDVEALWDARPELGHVRDFALARRAQPWAVLGVALARIVTATPCWLVLPPLVGDVVPLNLFVGIVGKPGSGKGAATRAAARAVDVGPLIEANVGSGEGIAHMFLRRTRQVVEQHTTAVLFDIAEIDTLAALDARRGTTLLPELRKAWIGETLGFAYADPAKRLLLRPHTYRLTLVAGIQPTRAGVLLDDGDGGTPQRFLWLPAANPDAPDEPPTEPKPLTWAYPRKPVNANGTDGLVHIHVCQKAQDAVVTEHLAQHRGNGDDLDAHAGLARLKVAAALGLFAGRYSITDEDWDLSGLVMAKSDVTRAGVVDEMARTLSTANTARAKAEATRRVIVKNADEADDIQKAGRAITRKLFAAGPAGMAHSELHRALFRHRPSFDDAIEGLIETGQITAEHYIAGNGASGRRYTVVGDAR